MRRCSWFVAVGFTLLLLGLAYYGYHYWYAGEYVPDFPARNDGKFIHTPRSARQISAIFGAGLITVTASVVSLIGIAIGPRTLWCLVAGLIGPVLIALPIAILNFNERFMRKGAMSMSMDFSPLLAWLVPLVGVLLAGLYGASRARSGANSIWGAAFLIGLALGFALMFLQVALHGVCVELHGCVNRGDGNMTYWFQSFFAIPIYWVVAAGVWRMKQVR